MKPEIGYTGITINLDLNIFHLRKKITVVKLVFGRVYRP